MLNLNLGFVTPTHSVNSAADGRRSVKKNIAALLLAAPLAALLGGFSANYNSDLNAGQVCLAAEVQSSFTGESRVRRVPTFVEAADRVESRAYAPEQTGSRAYAPTAPAVESRPQFVAPEQTAPLRSVQEEVAPAPLSSVTTSAAPASSARAMSSESSTEVFVPNVSASRAYAPTPAATVTPDTFVARIPSVADVVNSFRPENPLVPYCTDEPNRIASVGYTARSGSLNDSETREDVRSASSLLGALDREKARCARSVRDSVLYIDARKVVHKKVDSVHGSGCAVQYNGRVFVVTNNHISSCVNSCDDVTITTSKGSTFKPCAIFSCPDFDIDALEIDPNELQKHPELRLCNIVDSSCLEPGYGVFTIGSPLFMDGTLTYCNVGCLYRDTSELQAAGIIRDSDVGNKDLVRYIQLNGIILEGNSGGPLFTSQGEIVGVVTATIQMDSCSTGVGFAIPIEDALSVIRKMVDSGSWRRSYFGVVLNKNESLEEVRDKGVELTNVESGSPAELAGLRSGDYVYAFNGVRIKSSFDLARMIAISNPDELGQMKIFREGRMVDVEFKTAAASTSTTTGKSLSGKSAAPTLRR